MKSKLLLVLSVFVIVVAIAMPQSAEGQRLKPQQKLLAKRAAQVDAYRNLAERIKGLQINSQTYVRDFVAESDQISTHFDTFIKGARIAGQPRYMPDGTCEVDIELTMKELVTALQEMARFCTFGHKHSFGQMTQYVQETVIRATGSGVPRDEAYSDQGNQISDVSTITSGIPGWEDVTARGRLMGERAAKVDAYRNLAETVKGIRISGQTYVRDFVAESDFVQTSLDTFIKGVRQSGAYRYLPDGEVEVDVDVTIQEVVKELKTIHQHLVQRGWRWRRDIFRTIKFEEIVAVYPKQIVRSTGNGVVPDKYRTGIMGDDVSYDTPAQMPSWAAETVSAVGSGVAPDGVAGTEGRLMAVRAAELDARRQLVEKVYGVYINSETTVNDYVVQNDQVKAQVEQFLVAAAVSDPRYLEDGSVEVTAEIPLEALADIIRN